jgi:SAM-dependent methyltransferase
MLHQINPYNEEQFKEEFSQTDIFKQLTQDHDRILWEADMPWHRLTPRYLLANSMFTACSFFYLKYLTELNPTTIYDIGCGANMFKKYIPSIIGIDPDNEDSRDLPGVFDSDFANNHENEFQAAFAFNSIHFVPITGINQQVSDFIKVIKPGGRGVITINSLVVHIMTPVDVQYNMGINNFMGTFNKLIETIELPNVDILVCDFQDNGQAGNEINGDIRIVFEKSIQTS